jgi:hypothetical protein
VLAVGALALACAGAFYGGSQLQTRVWSNPARTRLAGSVGSAAREGEATAAASPGSVATGELGRLGTALSTAMRSHAAPNAPSKAYVETDEQRAERHRTIDRHLTETLGAISPEKRAALLEFNDEATQVQFGLQAAVIAGSISQADYDTQIHQRIVVQLDQLRSIVTDDEYRKLTGLQPGVDPYEYMRTGIGAAPNAEPGPVAEK